jgi:hypothetical protein
VIKGGGGGRDPLIKGGVGGRDPLIKGGVGGRDPTDDLQGRALLLMARRLILIARSGWVARCALYPLEGRGMMLLRMQTPWRLPRLLQPRHACAFRMPVLLLLLTTSRLGMQAQSQAQAQHH